MTTPAQQDPMVRDLLQQNRDTLDRRKPAQQEQEQPASSPGRDRDPGDDAPGGRGDASGRDGGPGTDPARGTTSATSGPTDQSSLSVDTPLPVDHSDSPYGAAAWRERIQSPEYQQLQRELYRRGRGMGPDASGWRYTEDVTGEGYGEGVYRVTEEGHEVTGLPRPQYRPTAGERQILHRYLVTGGGDPTEEIDPTGFGLRGDRLPGFGKRDYTFHKPEPGPGDPSQASPDMGIDYYGGVFSAESPVDAFSQPEDRLPTPELQGQPDLGVAAGTRFAEVAPNLGDLLPDDPTGDYSTDTGGRRRSTSSEIAPNLVDSFRADPVTFSVRGDPHEQGYQPGPTTSQAVTVADRGDIQDLGTAHHPITVEDRPHAFPVEALQDEADYLEPPLWLWSPDQAYMHGDAQRWEVAPNSGLAVPVGATPVALSSPTPVASALPAESPRGWDSSNTRFRKRQIEHFGSEEAFEEARQASEERRRFIADKIHGGLVTVHDKTLVPFSPEASLPGGPYVVTVMEDGRPGEQFPFGESFFGEKRRPDDSVGSVSYVGDPQDPAFDAGRQVVDIYGSTTPISPLTLVPIAGTGLIAAKFYEDHDYSAGELAQLGVSGAVDVLTLGTAGTLIRGGAQSIRGAGFRGGARVAIDGPPEWHRYVPPKGPPGPTGSGPVPPASRADYLAKRQILEAQAAVRRGGPAPQSGFSPIHATKPSGLAVVETPRVATAVPKLHTRLDVASMDDSIAIGARTYEPQVPAGFREAQEAQLRGTGQVWVTTPNGLSVPAITTTEPASELQPQPDLGVPARTTFATEPTPELQPQPDLGVAAGTTFATEPTPELQPQPDLGVAARTTFATEPTLELQPQPDLGVAAKTSFATEPTLELQPQPDLGVAARTSFATEPTPELQSQPDLGVAARTSFATETTPQLQTQPDPGVAAGTSFATETTPTAPTTPTTPPTTPRIDLSARRPKPPRPRVRIRLPRPGPDPGRSREAPRTRGNQPHIVEWVSHSLNRLDLRTGEHASRPASDTNVNTFRITGKGAESTDGKQYRAANLDIESSRGRAHATPVPGRKRRRSRRSRRDEADQAFPGTLTFVPRDTQRRR